MEGAGDQAPHPQRRRGSTGLAPGDVLADLGFGNGSTIATASRVSGRCVVGVDVHAASLEAAASWLDEIGSRYHLVCSDLDAPLSLRDGSVTHVVCSDVLECLADPGALLAEAHRVLRPGGTAVWSHVDYESAVVSGADRRLTRRVVQAYAEATDSRRPRSDAQMGRRLAALVARSPLVRTAVDAHTLLATDLSGPGGHRIDDIVASLRRGTVPADARVTPDEIDRWESELRDADARGEFFYSQTAYIVTSTRP